MKDYYSILQIPKNATSKDIKAAYRNLSKKYHPDVNKAHNATAIFIEIKEAYELLIDESRKFSYDQLINTSKQNNNQYANITPTIKQFYCNTSMFKIGDVVEFNWEVVDADIVELRPFGKVSQSGSKKIRITDVSTNLLVELFCYNSVSKNYVFSQIILQKEETIIKQESQDNSSQNTENEHLNYFEKLIKNNPQIDPRHFQVEKLVSIYSRIDQKIYVDRVVKLSLAYFIFLLLMYFVSALFSFFSLVVSSLYFTIIYIQARKRFHDFNSKGYLAFISAIPILHIFQAVYLSKKPGDSKLNNFGLPVNSILKKSNEKINKKVIRNLIQISLFAKVTFATLSLNVLITVGYFFIPRNEVGVVIDKVFSKILQHGSRNQIHYFIEFKNIQIEVSEIIATSLNAKLDKTVYLGINRLTDNINYIKIYTDTDYITHYISGLNYNSPLQFVYFLLVIYQFYVLFFDKKSRNGNTYNSILRFLIIINIVYFIYFII